MARTTSTGQHGSCVVICQAGLDVGLKSVSRNAQAECVRMRTKKG